jgi:hypothetical protein
LALSCNKDETDILTDKTALNLVTGINCRHTKDQNEIVLQLGARMFSVNNKFKIYPNPANESVYILAQENVTDVWLVSAKPKKIHQDVNFSSILNTDLYSEQSIITNSIVSLSDKHQTVSQ